MLVSKEFTFDSAHYLTAYHGKCERLHGHTYKLRVTVEGAVSKEGMVVDFCELKALVGRLVVDKLDHQSLNDFFKNPSAENMVIWMWKELEKPIVKMAKGVKLYEIVLFETQNNFVTYRGK
ncbi:MAG: 6-carboxytetrahydropterin synthase QueD [Candidatus Gracilibacteria bacterium]